MGEPVGGYGRRDLLSLVTAQPVEDALVVLERTCAQAGQAYRLALSIAIERAARLSAPRAAQLQRVYFAELEMIASGLWTLSEIARTLNLRALRIAGLEQRERIYEAAQKAIGERVYWGIARPGGVSQGLDFAAARETLTWLPSAVDQWRSAVTTGGALQRMASRMDECASAERADAMSHSQTPVDARRTAPYDGYRSITLDWFAHDDLANGASEISTLALRLVKGLKLSHDIMRACADALVANGQAQPSAALKAGQGSAYIQSAHGPVRLEVSIDEDAHVTVSRLETRCIETRNAAIAALVGRPLISAPALLAGLGVCPSCVDM